MKEITSKQKESANDIYIPYKEFYEEIEKYEKYNKYGEYNDRYWGDRYYPFFYEKPQVETEKERKIRIKEEKARKKREKKADVELQEKIRISKVKLAIENIMNNLLKEIKELNQFFTRNDILDI
ncbi:hypothetical protein LCGC14_1269530 [marine sediment metagenome]|uniref:Uncharacterized protein n=1 Tax=marine sediment metagenome TaxID=412755 RepID=A0A0F9L0C0_9ZZZZ